MIEKCENTLLKQRCENLCTTLQLKSQQEKATICTFAHSHICTLTKHLHILYTTLIKLNPSRSGRMSCSTRGSAATWALKARMARVCASWS